jgi:muramoyltetrapeptide carboxypeptidase
MPIKPNRLSYGDTIGLIAPASPPQNARDIDRAAGVLEELGFETRLAPHVRRRWGFLAGSDRDRAGDLMKMFTDKKVRAILCVRGGYGASRLLPLLDYQIIRAHPKIFIGYSDITSIHCALLAKSDLVSFHGPMLSSDFLRSDLPKFTLQGFLRTLVKPAAPGGICHGYRRNTITVLRTGKASGCLIGGTLSILCSVLGTPFQPSFKDTVLFFEEVNEPPYRLDRMLTQLLNAGLLQQASGVAIGSLEGCSEPKANRRSEYRQTVEDVLRERLLPLRVPVIGGLPFGHSACNATLPIGLRVTLDALDAEKGDLAITESAVL